MTAQVSSDIAVASILSLGQELIRIPSQGGIDNYDNVIDASCEWMQAADLHPRIHHQGSRPVAVSLDVHGSVPGPHYVLDACLDTAAIGDPTAWRHDPFSGDVVDGWLYGRGSADSKVAASIFMHLARDLSEHQSDLAGRLTLLFDVDEHTGGFAGLRTWLAQQGDALPAGVMIGYPGPDAIVIGGRGVYRARITVHGEATHTGSSKDANNAVLRAMRLIQTLDSPALKAVDPHLGLPGKASVTRINAGTDGSWSVVPDVCHVDVDVRLTTLFQQSDAEALLRGLVNDLDREYPAPRSSSIADEGESWPPYRLSDSDPLVQALNAGAMRVGLHPRIKVAGPSNIGCLLAQRGVSATAGFGVEYRGLHGVDEAIAIRSVPQIYGAYRAAVLQLLCH